MDCDNNKGCEKKVKWRLHTCSAAGLNPKDMVKPVMDIKRSDIWDLGGIGGLLRGGLFHSLLLRHLPVHRFEDCRIPLGAKAYSWVSEPTK